MQNVSYHHAKTIFTNAEAMSRIIKQNLKDIFLAETTKGGASREAIITLSSTPSTENNKSTPPSTLPKEEIKSIVPKIDSTNQFCFFNVPSSKLPYIKSLQQMVGKKEIQIKSAEKSTSVAYLSLNWLRQLQPSALDELAHGTSAPEQEGENRTGAGISREFLESISKIK